MKRIREYIIKWRDSDMSYELQDMLKEAMLDAYREGIDEAIRIVKEQSNNNKKKA